VQIRILSIRNLHRRNDTLMPFFGQRYEHAMGIVSVLFCGCGSTNDDEREVGDSIDLVLRSFDCGIHQLLCEKFSGSQCRYRKSTSTNEHAWTATQEITSANQGIRPHPMQHPPSCNTALPAQRQAKTASEIVVINHLPDVLLGHNSNQKHCLRPVCDCVTLPQTCASKYGYPW
jgi:hypothetical protein